MGDGTLPFDELKLELKEEIDNLKAPLDDEYKGNIGRVMRSFNYDCVDSSAWYIAVRYYLIAVYLYRTLPHTGELFDLLIDLLVSRDSAIYEKLKTTKCEV